MVNNCTWLSNVAPSYAPDGQALLSATIIGNPGALPWMHDHTGVGRVRLGMASKTDCSGRTVSLMSPVTVLPYHVVSRLLYAALIIASPLVLVSRW